MMKSNKLNIFWKTFFVTISMLLCIVLLAYMLLYFLLPVFYKNYKIAEFDTLTSQLISQLEQADTMDDERELLTVFVQDTSANLILFDENGELIYQFLSNSTITEETGSGNDTELEIFGDFETEAESEIASAS